MPKNPKTLILVAAFVPLLIVMTALILRDSTRARVQLSAADIALLRYAAAYKTIDMASYPLFPDEAFQTTETRRRYKIPETLTQAFIDQVGRPEMNNADLYTLLAAKYGPGKVPLPFQMRLRRWQVLVSDPPYLPVFAEAARRHTPAETIFAERRRQAQARHMTLVDYNHSIADPEKSVPRDPFAPPPAFYRYGLSPLCEDPAMQAFWIIAGNGPDGDPDVDEIRIATGAAREPVIRDPQTGRERLIVELAYDPTNGTRSNGDIFIIGQSSTVWFKNAFIKEYGL